MVIGNTSLFSEFCVGETEDVGGEVEGIASGRGYFSEIGGCEYRLPIH